MSGPMNKLTSQPVNSQAVDTGLRALCGIAAYYRIAADPAHLQRELALIGRGDRDAARVIELDDHIL